MMTREKLYSHAMAGTQRFVGFPQEIYQNILEELQEGLEPVQVIAILRESARSVPPGTAARNTLFAIANAIERWPY